MDSREIDRAMRLGLPVVCDGVRYDRIREYVSWYDIGGNRRLSVAIQKGNYCQRVSAEKVRLWEENDEH